MGGKNYTVPANGQSEQTTIVIIIIVRMKWITIVNCYKNIICTKSNLIPSFKYQKFDIDHFSILSV